MTCSVIQISTIPILSVFNFVIGTDKTEIDETWTTEIGGPNFIRTTNFIRPTAKILRGVNGAQV